jgi:hypothetical protein
MAVLRGRICPVERLIAETASTIFRIMSRGLDSKQFISAQRNINITRSRNPRLHIFLNHLLHKNWSTTERTQLFPVYNFYL